MLAGDVRRVEAARAALRGVWAGDAPLVRVAEAMAALVPRSCGMAYDVDDQGRHSAIGQTMGGVRRDSFEGMVGEALMTPRMYGIEEVGPDANRIVGMRELDARYPERMVRIREELFAPNGVAAQLRVVFGDPHLLGYVGVYRFSGTREFDEDDVALFAAVMPDLQRALAVWRALGHAPLPRGLVGDVLDALDQPAYILAGVVVLFANGVARAAPLPEWLDAVGRGDPSAGERRGATVRPLEIEGRSFTLVLAPRETGRAMSLPRWLERVAEVAAEGLSDKEIAARLSMPLATVRTAMQRIYARTGVHSRAELVRRWLETREGATLGAGRRAPRRSESPTHSAGTAAGARFAPRSQNAGESSGE